MDSGLKDFLQGRTPLAKEEMVWPAGETTLVQTRFTYALEVAASPPPGLVTSVRALLTRGSEIMVVRDPAGRHILPGGRVDAGEKQLDALKRELLEETGWSVRATPPTIGLFHYHIHSQRPDKYPYPFPDFLQLIYRAQADQHFPGSMEVGGYELGAAFRPRSAVEGLSLSVGECALLALLARS